MVVVIIIGTVSAMVVPNLMMLVPETRIEAACKSVVSNVDFLRSEARITGKKLRLEIDIDRHQWRYVLPPEQQITLDQDVATLEEQFEEWTPIGEDVVVVSAGNRTEGLVERGIFAMYFDENGFTSDQSIVLQLESEPNMTWTVQIHGLTGRSEIVEDNEGNAHLLEETGEGAF